MGELLVGVLAVAAAIAAGVCIDRISSLARRLRELDDYVRKLHAYVADLHAHMAKTGAAPADRPSQGPAGSPVQTPPEPAPHTSRFPPRPGGTRISVPRASAAPATDDRAGSADRAAPHVDPPVAPAKPAAGHGATEGARPASSPAPYRPAPPAAVPPPAPVAARIARTSDDGSAPPPPREAPPAGAATAGSAAGGPAARPAMTPMPGAPAASPESDRPAGTGGLEAFLGGRVALVVGVIAVLVGIGYFLKIAIDEGWIGERLRIVLGALFGLGCAAGGDRLRRRGFDAFGQSLTGAGLGALYLCDYFGAVRYGLWSRELAFGIVAALTAGGTVLAVRWKAPFLAWLGFAGAYLAPLLLGRNVDALEGLTAWLAVVHLGAGAALVFRPWKGLDAFTACVSAFYFLGWHGTHFRDERLGAATACLVVLVAVALVVSLLPAAVARRRLAGASIAAALGALLAGWLAAYALCFPDHRGAMAFATLGFAAAVTGFALLHRQRVSDGAPDAEALFGTAVALVVMSVPILFRGTGVAPAWSAVGAAAIHAATKLRRPWLVTAGFVAISLAGGDALRLRIVPGDAAAPGAFGAGFFSALAPCAALLVAAWSLRRADGEVSARAERSLTISSWCAALFLAHEAWHAADPSVAGAPTAAAAAAVAAFAGLVAVLTGRRGSERTMPAWGPLVLVVLLGAALVLGDRPRGLPPVANRMFLAGLGVFASLVVSAVFGVRQKDLAAKAAAVYLLALATSEAHAWGRHLGTLGFAYDDARFRAATAMVAIWSVHGFLCVAGGWKLDRRWARGLGLLVLSAAALQPFVVRLAFDGRDDAGVFGASFWIALLPAAALTGTAALARRCTAGGVQQRGRSPQPDGDRPRADEAGSPEGPRVARTFCGTATQGAGADRMEVGALVSVFLLLSAEISGWGEALRASRPFSTVTALTMAWSLLGAACAGLSMAIVRSWLRPAAIVLGVLAAGYANLHHMFDPPSEPGSTFGLSFVLAMLPVATFAVTIAAARRARPAGAADVRSATGIALVHILLFVSAEILAWGRTRPVAAPLSREDAQFTAQVVLSAFWALYAALHVGAGFLWKSAALRWAGLGLFSLTVAKVFLIDLSRLDTVSRMGSVLALGVLLVAASFLYQRSKKGGESP